MVEIGRLADGGLIVADPLGFFGGDPKPATSTPAVPGSSAPRGANPGTESGGDEKAVQPDKTPEKERVPTRAPSPTATRPAQIPATTTPTGEATTTSPTTTSTPEQTATTEETGAPEANPNEPEQPETD